MTTEQADVFALRVIHARECCEKVAEVLESYRSVSDLLLPLDCAVEYVEFLLTPVLVEQEGRIIALANQRLNDARLRWAQAEEAAEKNTR